MTKFDCDTIVIGTGFGGAVMAARLAAKGHRVIVLERGRRWSPANFPYLSGEWLWDNRQPQRRHGWFDVRLFPQMGVVQGAGVGGGSLVYANASIDAKENTFRHGWPPEIRYKDLKKYYDMVRHMLQSKPVPSKQSTKRAALLRDAADKIGHASEVEELDLAISFDSKWHYGLPNPHDPSHSKRFTNAHGKEQGTCVHLGYCDIGCPVNARNTLDLNYIASAEEHRADIRELHIARAITPMGMGYRVDFERIVNGALVPGSVTAERVVVSAGSLNTTELLLRCRDVFKTLPRLSLALGVGWSSNGDFLTPAFYPWKEVSPTKGPTISMAINLLETTDTSPKIYIEDGGFPDVALRGLEQLSRRQYDDKDLEATSEAADLLVRFDLLDRVMPWFAQGRDASNGRLRLKDGALYLDWDPTQSVPVIEEIIDKHVQLSIRTGGVPLIPPTWTLRQMLITPHPLGGARMGRDVTEGVVDHLGRVFEYDRLYVVDGSVVPRAIGLNPSKTIAALAERCAEHV